MSDIFRVTLFLLWVNGLPPLAAVLLHQHYEWPIDGGRSWVDGQPIFGRHKTIRGLLAGSVGGALAAPLLGLTWWVGGLAGLLAMTGDLFSSFCKRRMALASGRNVVVFDQIFEALLPLLYLNQYLPLTFPENVSILALFIIAAHLFSRLWAKITEHPVPRNYPRVVHSAVRYREWKSCHTPLAKWQVWFNLSSFLSDQILLTWFFKLSGLYARGERNALDIRIEEKSFSFARLPAGFDSFRILLLVDLHLDGLQGIEGKIRSLLHEAKADLCLMGGDLRMKTYGHTTAAMASLTRLMRDIHPLHGTFGVLGNHDCIEMLPELEDAGVVMLVNDSQPIEHKGERIWLSGVDDPHYYRLHDAELATRDIDQSEFVIFLAHSPEAYSEAAATGADLYLCGHTHGGQVCLRQGSPIITNSRAPRSTASGAWRHLEMQGYTSRGVGPSSIPVRFNCPGEISLITLRRG